MKSVSSVRSVMSAMSSLWSNITGSAGRTERQMDQYRENIRYLYSCFTKLPALKLCPDHQATLVSGYEEFPFDSAVPLFAFKNVSALEICDLDFRSFHGWDRLAEQLRSLTVRRANLEDPIDLLRHIVLDDGEKRRRRSFKTLPTTPSTPGSAWPSSPKPRKMELARTVSVPNSPVHAEHRHSASLGSPFGIMSLGPADSGKGPTHSQHRRQRSDSPTFPSSAKSHGYPKPPRRGDSIRQRRSSGSSGSSYEVTPRNSTTDLLTFGTLPSSKWRFLRHLSLAENALTHISVTSLVPVALTLHSLDLSGNLFNEIPDALSSLTHLRALNLSNCMIDSLQSLTRSPLPAITTLNLRSNRLANLSGIERLFSLERLDLRDNVLRDPCEIARLTALPDLLDLYVFKNPFTKTHTNYRVAIFNLFRSTPGHQHDVVIDGHGPKGSEKAQLVDRVPEPPNKPVVPLPVEDEHPPSIVVGAPTEGELQDLDAERLTDSMPLHRRCTSNFGPRHLRRKPRSGRPRLVELTHADADAPESHTPTRVPRRHGEDPSLTQTHVTPQQAFDLPSPESSLYHTAPTRQTHQPSAKPALDSAFSSPTPAPKMRLPTGHGRNAPACDTGPVPAAASPTTVPETPPKNPIKHTLDTFKTDLSKGWLGSFGDNRSRVREDRSSSVREFSPASKASTIRAETPVPSPAPAQKRLSVVQVGGGGPE